MKNKTLTTKLKGDCAPKKSETTKPRNGRKRPLQRLVAQLSDKEKWTYEPLYAGDDTPYLDDWNGFGVTICCDSTDKNLRSIRAWLKQAEKKFGNQYGVELGVSHVTTWGEYKKDYRLRFDGREPEGRLCQIVRQPIPQQPLPKNPKQ